MTIKQLQDRAKKNGYKVETFTQKDLDKKEKIKKQQRAETDKILNQVYVSDKTFVRGSRMDRIGRRATRRAK